MKFTLVINEQMAHNAHINHLLSNFFSDISIPLLMRTFGAGVAWPLFWEWWIYFFLLINTQLTVTKQLTVVNDWSRLIVPFLMVGFWFRCVYEWITTIVLRLLTWRKENFLKTHYESLMTGKYLHWDYLFDT